MSPKLAPSRKGHWTAMDQLILCEYNNPLSGEVLAWLSVCSEVQTCIWPLLLTVSCFSKIQIGFTKSGTGGSPEYSGVLLKMEVGIR